MFVCYRIEEGVGISLSVSSRGWTALLVLVHPHSILCYNLGGERKPRVAFLLLGFFPILELGDTVAALPFTSFIGDHVAQHAFYKPFAYPRLFQLPLGASDAPHSALFVAYARCQIEAMS